MIGVLIVSHGSLCKALLETAEMIMGEQEHIYALGLAYDVDAQDFRAQIEERIKELDDGNGVIVLADLFGGTPANTAAACLKNLSFPAIAGVNLPMLLECLSLREDGISLNELAMQVERKGKDGIVDIAELLKK